MSSELADWVRIWAARNRKSVSRMIAEMVQKKREEESQYEKAMKAYSSREPSNLNSGKPYPGRDELYD